MFLTNSRILIISSLFVLRTTIDIYNIYPIDEKNYPDGENPLILVVPYITQLVCSISLLAVFRFAESK